VNGLRIYPEVVRTTIEIKPDQAIVNALELEGFLREPGAAELRNRIQEMRDTWRGADSEPRPSLEKICAAEEES
jgi:hypothetical protein